MSGPQTRAPAPHARRDDANDEMDDDDDTLLDIALSLAAQGLPVFPCAASKRPAIPEHEGGHGCKDATTDLDNMRALFATAGSRAALVGVATGEKSNIDVLDIDPRHSGRVWLNDHASRLPETLIHATPSGGEHHVFRHFPGIRNSAGLIAPGVDVRGEGGYAIWPPSTGYTVIHDAEVAEWPNWLLVILEGKPAPQPATPTDPAKITDARLDGLLRSLLARLSQAPEGQKHDTLLRIARTIGGYAHYFGLSDDQLVQMMLSALPATVIDWRNAEATARDGLAYGRAAPLELEDRPNPTAPEPQPPPPDQPPGDIPQPAPLPSRTVLTIVKGEYVATAEKIEELAIAAHLPIYSHGEALCRPVSEQRKRHDGERVTVAALRNYTTASLRRAVYPAISFNKYDGRRKATVACEPPGEIISMVLAGAQKQVFPPIRGIVSTPVLRPSRTIINRSGYDAETSYFVTGFPRMEPILVRPSRTDAVNALAVLADLISEFPFADDVSRSVAHSSLITPQVRPACRVVPGHLLTAPKQGSGKSLLVDTVSAIATGEPAYAVLAHKDPVEMDKQLTGALLEARQIIALDNLTGEIESSVLAQATEREHLSLRPLGTSQTISILNSFGVYLTGNNVSVAGDNTRRLLVSRIDPQVENPLDRTFHKPNPVSRVLQDRGRYVAACLTIVLAYLAAGRPNPLPPTPSYAEWSELVREPLVWLGLPDPTDSMRAAFDDDPTNSTLATLMAAWPAGQDDWTSAELIEAAMKTDQHGASVYPGLAEALKPIGRDRRGIFDAYVLGLYLRQNRDKIVGGHKISRLAASHGSVRWGLK